MSKLNEHELLMFLSGNADKKEMQNIQDWVSESDSHAQDLEEYKLIFDNFNELAHFKPIDDEAEWSLFMSKASATSPSVSDATPVVDMIEDVDILAQLDGMADYDQKSKVQIWRSTSTENELSFQILKTIHKEGQDLKNYRKVDAGQEWAAFEQLLAMNKQSSSPAENVTMLHTAANVSVTPSYSIKTEMSAEKAEQPEARILPMWYRYAAAASIAVVFAVAWLLWPRNSFETIYANQEDKTFELRDGSEVVLHPNSSLTYPKKFKDERRVYLDGKGTFSIESDPKKPFTVEARQTKLGVTVLGTKFRFEDSDTYTDVIENIEGSIRAYSIENPEVYVTMSKGDKYGFDGKQFYDLKDIPIIDNSKEYNILYVLDFLMKSSAWKVISAPYIKFDEKGVVKIDLDKPIDEIFEDLGNNADFQFSKLQDCPNCYRIERFAEKE